MSDIQEEIIFHLLGTCQSLDHALESHEATHLADDMAFLHNLDNQIFNCTCCNWWCGLEEAEINPESGEDICSDCYSSYED